MFVSVIDAFNFPVDGEFYQIENAHKKRRTLLSILANAEHRWNQWEPVFGSTERPSSQSKADQSYSAHWENV